MSIVQEALLGGIFASRVANGGSRQVCQSGNAVDVIVGVAGAGKTHALDCARAAWQAAGHPVIGTAVAGRAARQLAEDAHIPATTLDRLLLDLDNPNTGGFTPGTVVVVDEAGMAPTRKLARLLNHADAQQAKVVLVGDPAQLPEVEAGGVLAGLAARLAHTELHENRRQHDPGERHALAHLRAGNIQEAVSWYDDHGRITITATADQAIEQMVQRWWDDRQAGRDSILMAHRRSDTRRLAAAARARLQAAGLLHGPAITVAGRELQAGDDVMFCRNDRRIGVDNGDRGRVVNLDRKHEAIYVKLRRGRVITIPSDYLDAGHLDWGYAATVHKHQGTTVDTGHLLASDTLQREIGYTAASRGRLDNRLYLTGTDDDDLEPHAAVISNPPGDPISDLVGNLHRSGAKQLALDLYQNRDGLAW